MGEWDTAYPALTDPAHDDTFLIRDVSDNGVIAAGKNKQVTPAVLAPLFAQLAGIPVVQPSGVTDGSVDPGNVQGSISLFGAASLARGTYFGSSAVTYGFGQMVKGAGKELVLWNNLSSGPSFILENSGSYNADTPASLTGLKIDGTSASSGASAFQAGDIVKLDIDVWVSNFTGGNLGAHMLNAHSFTEQARVKLYIENCDNGIKLDQSGSGTNSFDRCEFDLKFNQSAAQNGIIFAGSGTTGVVLLGGVLRIHGNWGLAVSAPASSVISFVTANALIQSTRLEWALETGDSGSGTHTAQTVNFKDSSTVITNCYGSIEFLVNSASFQPSNNNGNIWFDGPVTGDDTLLVNVLDEPHTQEYFSFPAGWAGSITLRMPRGDGMVFFECALNVTSGTVMSGGETLVTGIPAWAVPPDTRVIPIDVSGTYGSIAIQAGGNIVFNGPGQTSANVFPYGQGWYRNT